MAFSKLRFPLTSEELEILLEFEAQKSLRDLAVAMGRDHSVITRNLKRIAEKHPVVEKTAGKWILTDLGRKVNDHTRGQLDQLSSVLSLQSSIRIGSNREFAARILAPDLKNIQKLFPSCEIAIKAFESGTENAILTGQIEIGIDCDRPNDPEISYKLIANEPIIRVASKNFFNNHLAEIKSFRYDHLPHLLCERLQPEKLLGKQENAITVCAKFNDIASTRAACAAGNGWALLPKYAVAQELESGILVQLDKKSYGNSKYGVWWPRRKRYLLESAQKLVHWLEGQVL